MLIIKAEFSLSALIKCPVFNFPIHILSWEHPFLMFVVVMIFSYCKYITGLGFFVLKFYLLSREIAIYCLIFIPKISGIFEVMILILFTMMNNRPYIFFIAIYINLSLIISYNPSLLFLFYPHHIFTQIIEFAQEESDEVDEVVDKK